MKLFIAGDHRGVEVKKTMLEKIQKEGFDITDLGTNSTESCDYPLITKKLCEHVLSSPNNKGILICGSAIGVSIAANKVKGIRAGIAFNEKVAQSSVSHNNCNVICIPADHITEDQCFEFFKIFINAEFEGGRHLKRINQIEEL